MSLVIATTIAVCSLLVGIGYWRSRWPKVYRDKFRLERLRGLKIP